MNEVKRRMKVWTWVGVLAAFIVLAATAAALALHATRGGASASGDPTAAVAASQVASAKQRVSLLQYASHRRVYSFADGDAHFARLVGVSRDGIVVVKTDLADPNPALRDFVAEALKRDPALALDSLRLRREPGGQIKAELAWVLHMQVSK